MILRVQTWMSVVMALAITGCAARGNIESLEAHVREQETQLADLRRQLVDAQSEIELYRSEAQSLRTQLSSDGQRTLVAEQAAVLHRTDQVKFNTLLTSGFDSDGEPGDEQLSVLLMPTDEEGDLVKLVGAIELELFDMSLPAEQQRIGDWSFSAEEAREHWHRGFLSAGYLFHLDWQQLPISRELTLHGRFVAPDGRVFNTTAQVKVKPPQGVVPAVAHSTLDEPGTGEGPRRQSVRRISPEEIPSGKVPEPAAAPRLPGLTSDRWTERDLPTLR